MSNNYALQAEKRDRAGKGVARALRRENKVPAVIYGDGKEPLSIALPAKEINIEYHKAHMFTTLCDLDVGGTKHLVLARDVQLHPVNDKVEHVDFLRVNKNTKIAVSVPVHFINEDKCQGLLNKGVLNVVRHEVELLCSAVNIPEQIEVNLEGKQIGDAIKFSDAVLPEGTSSVIKNRNFAIATIQEPKEYVEQEIVKPIDDETAAAAAAAAEGGAAPAAGAAPAKKEEKK